MPLQAFGLGDSERVVHIAPRVDVSCQGAIHGHAEHVTLHGDDGLAVNAAKVGELLREGTVLKSVVWVCNGTSELTPH